MSFTLNYTGDEINAILARANNGGEIDDALDLKAPLESPALTGSPTAPTQPEGDDSTKVATTAYADRAADAAEAAAEAAAKEYTDEATGALYITDTASGSIASFSDGADGVAMRSVVVNITPVQSGSGDPSPDNVRPISGWTGAEPVRTGKNLWNGAWVTTALDNEYSGQWQSSYVPGNMAFPVIPGKSYAFSVNGIATLIRYRWLDKDKNSLGGLSNAYTVTAPEYASYLQWRWYGNGGTESGDLSGSAQLELGSTATAYEPYAGQTFPVTWESQAGEVFGGTIDVVSGELKVTHGILTANNFTMAGVSAGGQRYFNAAGSAKTNGEGISSMLKWRKNDAAWLATTPCFVVCPSATTAARVYDGTLASIEEFRTKYAELLVVYELAQPVTYQLTPQQITSLLGQNNVWSNTGDTEVTYVADPKLYIAKITGGGTLTLGSVSPLSVNRPVAISEEDLEQAGEVSEAVEAAAETVLPAESGETEEGAQE